MRSTDDYKQITVSSVKDESRQASEFSAGLVEYETGSGKSKT